MSGQDLPFIDLTVAFIHLFYHEILCKKRIKFKTVTKRIVDMNVVLQVILTMMNMSHMRTTGVQIQATVHPDGSIQQVSGVWTLNSHMEYFYLTFI